VDPEIQFPSVPFDLSASLILLGRRGSEAHGTFIPSTDPNSIDDRDLMGVVIPPVGFYLGLHQWEGAESIKGCWDVVLYEYRKFVRLLIKQNPNVIGLLWLEPEDYLMSTSIGTELISNRYLFRHRRSAYESFGGYALGQLKKMRGSEFKGYMGDRRKQLVQKHGYDTKNAAHLVRLLHMGREYLQTGELYVRRTWDRDMLMEIKRGGWSLERVQQYADSCFSSLEGAYQHSVLPEEPISLEVVNELVVGALTRSLK
jgi:predicted nucleotidyltransferase